jgi:hypothetical protein
MTITVRDNKDGTFLISKEGTGSWSIEPDPEWGIKITSLGCSLIPLNVGMLDRPDILIKQRKSEGIPEEQPTPIPMLIWCPFCTTRHIDEGKFATHHHHTHACQKCGAVWRPAVEATVGVQFLTGFKNP